MVAKYGGVSFSDGPSRLRGSFYWQAQLSLVGLRSGFWETIQTIRYGFTSKGAEINYMTPFFLNAPDHARDQKYQETINFINYFRR